MDLCHHKLYVLVFLLLQHFQLNKDLIHSYFLILCGFFFPQLSINAFDYNCHLDLIKLLRQEGELSRLRRARQKMSELFPLTEGNVV